MIEYRITKYNPKNRIHGIYKIHEWTSIGDIGKMFDDGVLTYNQYIRVEQAYIDCCVTLLQEAEISRLSVCSPEYYDNELRFPRMLHTESDIRRIIMCCLREKCWVKLEAKNFFIHFGYDYYMYIGTNLSYALVEEITKRYNLFCEKALSPYKHHDSNNM